MEQNRKQHVCGTHTCSFPPAVTFLDCLWELAEVLCHDVSPDIMFLSSCEQCKMDIKDKLGNGMLASRTLCLVLCCCVCSKSNELQEFHDPQMVREFFIPIRAFHVEERTISWYENVFRNHQNWSVQGVDTATVIQVSCSLHVRGWAVCTVC